jgi:hypothetical protein
MTVTGASLKSFVLTEFQNEPHTPTAMRRWRRSNIRGGLHSGVERRQCTSETMKWSLSRGLKRHPVKCPSAHGRPFPAARSAVVKYAAATRKTANAVTKRSAKPVTKRTPAKQKFTKPLPEPPSAKMKLLHAFKRWIPLLGVFPRALTNLPALNGYS